MIQYGTIVGYTPASGGFSIHIGFMLEPGKRYDQQISPDGGVTWVSAGEVGVPTGMPLSASRWSYTLLSPTGVPARLVLKA